MAGVLWVARAVALLRLLDRRLRRSVAGLRATPCRLPVDEVAAAARLLERPRLPTAVAVRFARRLRSVRGLRAWPWRPTRLAVETWLADMRLAEPARDLLEALEPDRRRSVAGLAATPCLPECWAPAALPASPMSETFDPRREVDGDAELMVLLCCESSLDIYYSLLLPHHYCRACVRLVLGESIYS